MFQIILACAEILVCSPILDSSFDFTVNMNTQQLGLCRNREGEIITLSRKLVILYIFENALILSQLKFRTNLSEAL